jgi:hypothetical protein
LINGIVPSHIKSYIVGLRLSPFFGPQSGQNKVDN